MSTTSGAGDGSPAPAPGRGGRRWLRWLGWGAVVRALAVAAVVAWWVLGAPDAEPGPLQAVVDDPDVAVTLGDVVVVAPAGGAPDSAPSVVFYPGARVPPQAYVATWAPVVEEVGATVYIPSMPLRLAVLDGDAAAGVRADATSTGPWWIGGHSLGGTMAASHAAATAGEWDGVVFWASYPNGDVLADADMAVTSISGTADGLTTPDDVDASRADLPADTDFVVLDGVNHAQFGAYGEQGGDGRAEVDDATARGLVADATVAALSSG